jgi:hypothetical protein
MKFCLEATIGMAGDFLDAPDGFDVFVVEIDQEYAASLLSKIDALREVKKHHSTIWEMYFWEPSGEWFARDHDQVEPTAKGEASRTECDQLVAREDEVCWTTIPKHASVYMVSGAIPRSALESIAKGEEVPA